jgi:hypothetical protein
MQRFTKEHFIGQSPLVAREKTINGEYKPHRHEFYEIEYILSGSGEYRIDDRVYPIQKGMLFFMTPLHLHSVSAKNCRVYNVMFSEELCNTDFLVQLLHSDHSPLLDTCCEQADFWQVLLDEIVASEQTRFMQAIF